MILFALLACVPDECQLLDLSCGVTPDFEPILVLAMHCCDGTGCWWDTDEGGHYPCDGNDHCGEAMSRMVDEACPDGP